MKLNLFQAVNEALREILSKYSRSVVIGEDVEFGGVFRCTSNLKEEFGKSRVFNTPLCEQGIAGFATGMASMDYKVLAEIQFSDYIFPAFDQIVNEVAKFRYRSGGSFKLNSLIFRAPYGSVGHGGVYHSQSPEAFFTHCPGLKIVCPSSPIEAKRLLLASAEQTDPVIFLEPKRLYRVSTLQDPVTNQSSSLGKSNILLQGTDLTIIGWGAQTQNNLSIYENLKEDGISAEIIDLCTLIPLDIETLLESVKKTGRCIIIHEAPRTCGFASELCALLQEKALFYLKAPIIRCTGYDTPFPLILENYYLPINHKVIYNIKKYLLC